MSLKVGDVVTLLEGGLELNALVSAVHPDDTLSLVVLSPHEIDQGAHGRLSETRSRVPRSSWKPHGPVK